MTDSVNPVGDMEPVKPPAWRSLAPAATPHDPRDLERDTFKAQIRELEAKLEAQAKSHERAIERAIADATVRARESFDRDEADALVALEAALERATAAHEQALGGLEALAPLLCEAVLENILAETCSYGPLIENALQRQMATLRRESATYIALSQDDFGDPDALARVKTSHPGVAIELDPALERGECRIGLALGQVELSIERYRAEVGAKLRAWGAP